MPSIDVVVLEVVDFVLKVSVFVLEVFVEIVLEIAVVVLEVFVEVVIKVVFIFDSIFFKFHYCIML